jgi:hypothetical protein
MLESLQCFLDTVECGGWPRTAPFMSATKKQFYLIAIYIWGISGLLRIISEHWVSCPARDLVGGVGTFGIPAGLFFMLLHMMAARKER